MLLWSFILPNRSGVREELPFYLYDFLCTYRFSKFEGWFNWYSYWIHYFVCSIPNEADPSSEVGKYVLIKRSNQFYIYSFFFICGWKYSVCKLFASLKWEKHHVSMGFHCGQTALNTIPPLARQSQ